MAKHGVRFKPEQIVSLLRQIEVLTANGKTLGVWAAEAFQCASKPKLAQKIAQDCNLRPKSFQFSFSTEVAPLL